MAIYDLSEVNRRALEDPAGFVAECDEGYNVKIRAAADKIAQNVARSPIVLLSGPSGSGKTTTAKKIEQELRQRGVLTHTVSMDDYYTTVDPETHPRDHKGNIDFESPHCLDLALMTQHFDELVAGRQIMVPKFEFSKQRRNEERAVPLRLGQNEVAIYEGIHALNPIVTDRVGEHGVKMYISARSNYADGGKTVFKGTWMRLVRRLIRDHNYRGSPAPYTMSLWAGVRRGEKSYISPYKNRAEIIIDSLLPYEPCVLKSYGAPLLREVPRECERAPELREVGPALGLFQDIDQAHVAKDSLIREFIGGGSFSY